MEFAYVTRTPAAPLDRYVELIWYARGRIDHDGELIAPTGSTVAAVVLGSPIRQTPAGGPPFLATTGFLIGPHDRPIVNEPTAETHCLGIVTTPVGCRAALGLDPGPLRGRVTGWPPADRLRAELTGTPEEMLRHVEATLQATLRGADTKGVDRCARAVAALEAEPARNIAELAAALGVTHGHLDREFARVVGLGPRTLARILRVRRLLEHIDVYGRIAWTELAGSLGWFDQAHLIRDFKRHTGVTPSQYQAAQRRYRPDEVEPGFVPM
ncbi:helix-turn-helix domain-containing protein [Actinophytocola sp.]|uniref:helix-turn-helix domain-containing protein n=1 Tax=Actinophytocola sp. TaxID=1872138 RepID=UPI003D6C3A87